MSKVLVTGGAGYIGAVAAKYLVQEGYDVRILDKMIFGDESLNGLENRIEVVQGDIRELDPNVLDEVSSIIHFAGFSNDPMAFYDPKSNNEVNTNGTRILARAAAERGINRFTYGSSASVYDTGTKGDTEFQNEDSPVLPKNPYSISKFEGEQELLKVREENPEFSPVIMRQGTVYGHSPRMRFDLVVNTFVKYGMTRGKLTAFCGGTQWRPLVDVKDVARAHIAALKASDEQVGGQIFNLSEGNHQVWDVAHRVAHVLRDFRDGEDVLVEIDYSDDKIDRSYKLDGTKIEDKLGFRYQHNIDESARDIAERVVAGEYGEDLENPIFKNIDWIKHVNDWRKRLDKMGGNAF